MTLRVQRRESQAKVPEGMPILGAGAHPGPGSGACLMEYVSLLAGERFSDHPKTVHSGLAAVARVANDVLADESRGRLLPLAPDFVGTAQAGYDADPLLVGIVASVAQEIRPMSGNARAALAGAKRRSHRMQAGGRWSRVLLALTARHYHAHVGPVLAQLVAEDVAPAGDAEVVAVLQAAIAECRRRLDGSPPTRRGRRRASVTDDVRK